MRLVKTHNSTIIQIFARMLGEFVPISDVLRPPGGDRHSSAERSAAVYT